MATFDEVLKEQVLPAIGMDARGNVTFCNEAFERVYGWSKTDLIDKSLTLIIPPAMRDAHRIGFSRMISTGQAKLLNKPLTLTICRRDGREVQAEHLITGRQEEGEWKFAATIRPLEDVQRPLS